VNEIKEILTTMVFSLGCASISPDGQR